MSKELTGSIGSVSWKLIAKIFTGVAISIVLFWIGTIEIETTPPLWWDEGWALCVARTWVEVGHYGCRLSGQLAAPFQSQHLPTVAAVALGFSLLGVGIWQARITTLIVTIGALWVFYFLTERVFNRKVAVVTIILLVIFPAKWEIATLIIGRQVLGEMHALFYLLAGYMFFLLVAGNKQIIYLLLAGICWGIALKTKQQVLPFWAVSVVVPLIISLIGQQRSQAKWIMASIVIAIMAWLCLNQIENVIRHRSFQNIIINLFSRQVESQALVTSEQTRVAALVFIWLFGWPTLYGLGYGTYKWIANQRRQFFESQVDVVRLMLLLLAASWLGWYVALSAGWPRYAFPPIFLATPFLAALLHDLSNGYSPRLTFTKIVSRANPHRTRAVALTSFGLALIGLIAWYSLRDIHYLWSTTSQAPAQTANFLNQTVQPNEQIETVESELLFMLDRPYHYPLDFYQPYTSLTADYLVVGNFGRHFQLYEQIIDGNTFQLISTIEPYKIYKRIK